MDFKILGRMVLDPKNILQQKKTTLGRVKRIDNDKPLGRLLKGK
jgi:predicted RNA-binding protein